MAFLLIVFLTGGAARIDVQSLLILRPVSAVACALALLTLRREHFRGFRALAVGFSLVILLCVMHLLPLPPAIWHSLPGRDVLADVDRAVGLGDVWRPLTMTPMNGWHSLISLLSPLAVLLLGVQLNETDRSRILLVVLAMGGVSGLLGILQVIGSPTGPLYFYNITNNGSAVGLFSNRNHAAALLACMFPMLAVFASSASATQSRQRFKEILALGTVVVNVPLILVTGSRLGLFLGVVGLLGAALIYRRPTRVRTVRRGGARWRVGPAPVLAGIAILLMGLLTAFFSRADAFTRLFERAPGEDGRTEFWTISIDLIGRYFPWGSGLGSFVEVYKIAEPTEALNQLYVNHAHNDWIEIPMTMGLPGMVALIASVVVIGWQSVIVWRTRDQSRSDVQYAKMGAVVIGMLALASVTDYPLRTPSLMCILTLSLLWLFSAGRPRGRDRDASASPESK